ncbi:MAG TPA: hypothetical protein VHS97_18070, partial [Isosphaeraceae bacterium]|nr:hypothetical protein [Isosphaeraceae bacterium]
RDPTLGGTALLSEAVNRHVASGDLLRCHARAGREVGSRWPIIDARNALRPDDLRQVAERPEPTPAEGRHY